MDAIAAEQRRCAKTNHTKQKPSTFQQDLLEGSILAGTTYLDDPLDVRLDGQLYRKCQIRLGWVRERGDLNVQVYGGRSDGQGGCRPALYSALPYLYSIPVDCGEGLSRRSLHS